MTDSHRDSPCHPEIKLYVDSYGMLVCACGNVFHNPDDNTVTDARNIRVVR